MIKVLIVAAVFPPEPVVSAKLAYDIANKISENHSVVVLCPKPTRPFGFKFKDYESNHFTFSRILIDSYTNSKFSFWGRFYESLSFGIKTADYICKHQSEIDVIYADTWPLFAQLLIVRKAKKYHIPIVIHIQDIYPESLLNKVKYFSSLIKWHLIPLDKYILKNANKVIAITEQMKNHLILTRGIPESKVAVVLNWQDETSYLDLKNQNSKHEKFTFMYLGNIGPVAGVDLLIEAFQTSGMKNSRLIIAGAGSMKQKLINSITSNLQYDIQFWDVPEGKVPEIQKQADVLLLPIKKGASSSSIPSKLPAYMLSAKPVICCAENDSYTAKCIIEANCGFIVEPESPLLLANEFKYVYSLSNEELEEMGNSGFDYSLEFFSKKTNLELIVSEILKSAI